MMLLLIIIFAIYVVLILEFALASWRLSPYKSTAASPSTRFTIIVPFRNEAAHLPALLASLVAIDYPTALFEIILVNDGSHDNSVSIITAYVQAHKTPHISLIINERRSASPKKDAIQTAISHSNYEWILTTDADCTVHPAWLATLNTFILEKHPIMVVAPVAIAVNPSITLLNAYEQLDFLSLMGATYGGFGVRRPFLCNGANLCYKKSSFTAVGGFTSNNHIASGDDHFLLESFVAAFPKKVKYIRSQFSIVTTRPQEFWHTFIAQRTRWAAKSTGYRYWFSKFVGLSVLATNFLTVIIVCALLLNIQRLGQELKLFFAFAKAENSTTIILSLLLLFKGTADYLLIASEAKFYTRSKFLKWYPLILFMYPFISSYIAIKALVTDFEWKGRSYKR